jgi:hypothetical protein
MRILAVLICCFLTFVTSSTWSQQVFEIVSWSPADGTGVQGDSTGALILGDVDAETNLALRKIAVDQTGQSARVTDANQTRNSAWNSLTPQAFNFFIQLDLEEPRLINRVAIRPVTGNTTNFVKGYSLQTSTDNIVFFEQVLQEHNLNIDVDTSFVPVVARYVRVQVKAIDRVHNVVISEIEVYGEGFVSAATYESEALDFGDAGDKNYGIARWTPTIPEGTSLSVSFRIGATPSPSAEDAAWTGWTEASTQSDGVLIELPEPGRYLQYRVVMTTGDPSLTPRLEVLQIDYGAPLAISFTGSVTRTLTGAADDTLDVSEAPIGEQREFDLHLQSEAGAGGFDLLRLKLPNRAIVKQLLLNGAAVEDVLITTDGSTVEMAFGRTLTGGNTFDIRLSTVLFDDRNVFVAEVLDTTHPDNPQQVGASDEREDALAIFGVGVSDRVFDKGSLTVAPNPFSPNGDGRFDEVEFSYELAKIGTPQRVRLRIFDLRGRELQELTFRQKSGSHTVKWDGRGEDGQLVPPGLYLFQVNVDSGRPVRFSGSVVVSY